jgi:hypothetical protein
MTQQSEIDRMRAEPAPAVKPGPPWWTRLSPFHAAVYNLGVRK